MGSYFAFEEPNLNDQSLTDEYLRTGSVTRSAPQAAQRPTAHSCGSSRSAANTYPGETSSRNA